MPFVGTSATGEMKQASSTLSAHLPLTVIGAGVNIVLPRLFTQNIPYMSVLVEQTGGPNLATVVLQGRITDELFRITSFQVAALNTPQIQEFRIACHEVVASVTAHPGSGASVRLVVSAIGA
jgi:hypothetical protein